MSNLPTDPMILLSYVNTKLRDEYANLETMCDDMELNISEIMDKLATIDYHYNEKLNRFA